MMSKKGYVYLIRVPEQDTYKIGVTKDIEKRIKQLQTGNDSDITLVNKFASDYPYKVEAAIHRKYADRKIKGEWYNLTEEHVKSFWADCFIFENGFKTLDKMGNPFFS